MLKAKSIIRDLKTNLKGNKIFGCYPVTSNIKESRNLDISPLDIIRALAPYEIDFKKLYKVDFDDIIYEDKEGNYISLDTDYKNTANNSYNWSSQVVFNYQQIQVIDKYDYEHVYVAIKFHRYGDVRGNYTDYMILDMSIDDFYEVVMEATMVYCTIDIKGVKYCIDTDCLKEACIFNIYCNEKGIDDYDVMLDIDNLRSKKDIKKGLKEYLKTNYAENPISDNNDDKSHPLAVLDAISNAYLN